MYIYGFMVCKILKILIVFLPKNGMFERLLQACAAGASSLEDNSQLRLLWM
jgi:hypothetical protein